MLIRTISLRNWNMLSILFSTRPESLPVSHVTILLGPAVSPGSSRDRVLQLNSTDANFSTTVRIFPLSVVFLTGRSSGWPSLAQDRRLAGHLFVLGRR